MLLTIIMSFILTTTLVVLCKKSTEHKAKTTKFESETCVGTTSTIITHHQIESGHDKEKEKEKDKEIWTPSDHEFTAPAITPSPSPDAPPVVEGCLDSTQSDRPEKLPEKQPDKNGKKKKGGKSKEQSRSMENTKNRMKLKKTLNTLDRTQRTFEHEEINEDDDDTIQDAPSVKIRTLGPSFEPSSDQPEEKLNKKVSKRSVRNMKTNTK